MRHATLLLAASLSALPLGALADVEAGVKAKLAGYMEGARDLGVAPAVPPPGYEAEQDRTAAYADIDPYFHAFSEHSGFFIRGQLFGAAGDEVIQRENELPVAEQNYAALRELWVEHTGMTDFPGDRIRFGLQRVREQSGLWYDRDIESLRWIFDTTLVQADFGAGEQFSLYRTDDVELSPSQKKRAYAWGGLERQWSPGYWVGARAMYAQDHGGVPEIGETLDEHSKTQQREYLWIGLHTGNGYFDPRTTSVFQYWFEAIGLVGSRESAQVDETITDPADPAYGQVISHKDSKVGAFGGDAGLRFRFPTAVPFMLGVQGTYAQGDPGDDTSHQFQPSGLESNRARFTGTRTLINRFNEALQADWSNLRDAAGYLALGNDTGDLSLVYHQILRDDGTVGFNASGITARPVNDSTDIGQGVDLVASWFFQNLLGTASTSDDEDTRSNLRLRASQFMPGEAYGDGAKDQYRVTLEATLWF